ncbi:MAG: hypothetical protein TH68_02255, partial [Candidatus Synechococcus spongiarum 142]
MVVVGMGTLEKHLGKGLSRATTCGDCPTQVERGAPPFRGATNKAGQSPVLEYLGSWLADVQDSAGVQGRTLWP